MVEAIQRIGRVIGIKTVAEWVEDEATLSALALIGVDYAQGFGIGPPTFLSGAAPTTRSIIQGLSLKTRSALVCISIFLCSAGMSKPSYAATSSADC
jgi:predicted signal transduction protein with EAL and GGDEF domain